YLPLLTLSVLLNLTMFATNKNYPIAKTTSYVDIPVFFSHLKAANPTTITELETHADENGSHYLNRLFISHGASQEGFHFLRKLVVVAGANLRHSDSGFLIVVVIQDPNLQTYPLAFGVVDRQTEQA
ncbi:hypothetical protein EUTSA_v10012299mg, partial [Eutrema salsugineum]